MSANQTATWDNYIAGLLEKGYVSKAGIYGIKDGKTWATSKGFEVAPNVLEDVSDGFQDSCNLRKKGFIIGEHHFTFTRSNNTLIVGRDCLTGAGIVIYRCASCFIYGVYEDNISAGACYTIVNKMGEFLRVSGY